MNKKRKRQAVFFWWFSSFIVRTMEQAKILCNRLRDSIIVCKSYESYDDVRAMSREWDEGFLKQTRIKKKNHRHPHICSAI